MHLHGSRRCEREWPGETKPSFLFRHLKVILAANSVPLHAVVAAGSLLCVGKAGDDKGRQGWLFASLPLVV